MECNKEEAFRAKEIAEKKMENKDFAGARRIALKAQQLYPDLDNISQMLSVCEVHCSAEHRMFGNEMDWYTILQIEQTADEASIKKQYRKFALLLHPDKNKFPGAEAAFKLIGEAQRVLLDQGRRSLYDMKRKSSLRQAASSQPTQRACKNTTVGNYTTKQFTGLKPQNQHLQQQAQPAFANGRQTFWTVCPSCAVKYQYYREVINRPLTCQSCLKSFTAYDINAQGAPPGTNFRQPAVPASNGAFQGKFSRENQKMESFPKTRRTSEVEVGSKTDTNCGNVGAKVGKGGFDEVKPSRMANGKRKRKHVSESSESCETGSSADVEGDGIKEGGNTPAGGTFGCFDERSPRRSSRNKQNVSYSEKLSDDDCSLGSSKRAKVSGLSCTTKEGSESGALKDEVSKRKKGDGSAADVGKNENAAKKKKSSFEEGLPNGHKDTGEKGKQKAMKECTNGSEAVDDSASNVNPRSAQDQEAYSYPDPDFSNFEKKEGCFKSGQIWACYDTLDAMPRFYARIRKILSPAFRLVITWLEPNPDGNDEIAWASEGLPVSCGKFMLGNDDYIDDPSILSHMVYWEKGSGKDPYSIYPRSGETWALFKNWDIKWKSDENFNREFKYEFVEVLSDYGEGIGIRVAHLGKVRGFACLFCRVVKEGVDSFQIPSNELFRFSHRVPSFKMTGEEREDVPKGSFELDPASLPTDLEEIAVPENFEAEAKKKQPKGLWSSSLAEETKPTRGLQGSAFVHQVEKDANLNSGSSSDNIVENCCNAEDSDPETYEIPDPEFYDFDAGKSPERFQVGQIWALYSDEDGLPKYYGQIMKIDAPPNFQLHVRWLESCSLPKGMIRWHKKDMLICCGTFKLRKGKPCIYDAIGPFSHQVRLESTDKKGEYTILPRKGEVWALYKHWKAEMTRLDLKKCEYDIVEVVEEKDLWRKVSVLEHVSGFNSVFKAQVRDESPVVMEIPGAELLRFSHQIPAFQLTKEKDGSLRGFWELDPASLPVVFFGLN
ncbi:uncharacterized protein LOC131151874 [Malania oleifera]|uniref:uncharacterized protein LOC131151874 n=1 Tax=Malania oleifera TaxID=397392 RepID=UPI0025AE8779|nr:uncharacterized protein LOC131151874 [Malania oleifera]